MRTTQIGLEMPKKQNPKNIIILKKKRGEESHQLEYNVNEIPNLTTIKEIFFYFAFFFFKAFASAARLQEAQQHVLRHEGHTQLVSLVDVGSIFSS